MKHDEMKKPKKEFNIYLNKRVYIGGTLIFIIVSVFVFCWKQYFDQEECIDTGIFGQFGDFIGGVLGTVFALISVIILVNTFLQQQRITQENKNVAELQIFNSLFFELLKIYQDQTKELEFDETKIEDGESVDYTYNNKDFFDENKKIIQNIFLYESSYTRNNRNAKNDYISFYLKYKSKLAIYYRTLYRMFDLIDNSLFLDEELKKQYAKIIRAQLTESELFFLRYNSLTNYGVNFISYINKYNILKHLPEFELLEFKDWWEHLSLDDRSGIDTIFCEVKKSIKTINNNNSIRISIADRKYSLYVAFLDKKDLNVSIKIKSNMQVSNDSFRGFDQFNNILIQALFDCFLKEIVVYSNFSKFNTKSELIFYSLPIETKSNVTGIKCGVRCKDHKETIVFRSNIK